MKIQYEVDGWTKICEEDVFAHGCVGPTRNDGGFESFTADTVPELVANLQRFFDIEDNGVLIDSCEEDGRIDLQCLETDDCCVAGTGPLGLWKQGKMRLWACTYTVYVERVTRETVALSPHATPNPTTVSS